MVFWQLAFASQGDERHSLISMNRGKNINKMKYTILVTPFFARFVYYGLLKLARFPMKISFCEILKKQIASCVSTGTELLLLNGHVIGFRPQTLKLERLYETPSNPLAANTISKHSTVANYIVERDREKNVPP